MRSIILALSLAVPVFCEAGDLSEGWSALGSVKVTLAGETLDMQVLKEPNGKPNAFWMDAGGPTILSIDGHTVSDAGMPGWPSVSIDILSMGPMALVQEVQFYRTGGSNPELWVMREDLGEASISNGKVGEDGNFEATMEATLHRWDLPKNAEVAGAPVIEISAEIKSAVPKQ